MEPRVAKKYATALFLLARERKIEEQVWADISVLGDVLKTDRRLLKVIAAPQIPDENKHELVRAVLAGAHEAVLNFILFVIDKGRTENIPRMIDIYGQLLDEARGIVEAEITSAELCSAWKVFRERKSVIGFRLILKSLAESSSSSAARLSIILYVMICRA